MKIGNLGCVPLQVMWPFHLKRQTHPGPPPQRIMWPYASGSYKVRDWQIWKVIASLFNKGTNNTHRDKLPMHSSFYRPNIACQQLTKFGTFENQFQIKSSITNNLSLRLLWSIPCNYLAITPWLQALFSIASLTHTIFIAKIENEPLPIFVS